MTDLGVHIDLLTGAFKRSHFESKLIEAVSSVRRSHGQLSLLHVDVDDLQEHNDLHGRARLDQTLGWLAGKISEVIDGLGPIGRVGDDAFAVVLEGVPFERARRLGERLRSVVSQTLHASDAGDFRITVSIGVVALKGSELSGNLLDAAEEACRKAKQSGRDSATGR